MAAGRSYARGAFAYLYPIIDAVLPGNITLLRDWWAIIFSIMMLLTLALRWYGLGFEYCDYLAQETYKLWLRLGGGTATENIA